MKVQKSVEVSQKADEVGSALVSLVRVVKTQLEDGFQVGADLPPVMSEALKELMVIVGDVAALPDEAKEDGVCFVKTLALSGAEMAGVLLAPKAVAPAVVDPAPVAAPVA